jgi:CAAX prenyl protease-like protein
MTERERSARASGHGWGPYFWPYVAFGVIGQFGPGLPEPIASLTLPLKVIVPAGLLIYYFTRGHYPEFRRYPHGWSGSLLDFGVGLLGGAIWMAPYIAFGSMRPEETGFDPNQWGSDLAPLALAFRCVGYGIVTPFWEELLVRSWLIRYIDVFDTGGDFRDVPVGRYSVRSFWVVTVFFTLSHVPWEWWVAVPWVVGTLGWFYYRKNLLSLVIAHAGSNLGIFVAVVALTDRFTDASGNPLSLWFFV